MTENRNTETNDDSNDSNDNSVPVQPTQWKVFSYQIPWNEVSLRLMEKLAESELLNEEADPADVIELRQWVCQDLLRRYEQFKKEYLVKTKNPGVEVYKDTTSQICHKFQHAIGTNMHETLLRYISVSMENRGRTATPVCSVPPTANRVKGTPGVQAEAYRPHLTNRTRQTQEQQKEELKLIHSQSKQDTARVTMLMHQTYELQREQIIEARKKIGDSESETSEKQLKRLKLEWPFLFHLRWQSDHFLKLVQANIEIPMSDYVENNLQLLMSYLQSNTSDSSLKNIAEFIKWQTEGRNPLVKMLLAVKMLANYFGEDSKALIKCAERTTPPDEVQNTVPDLTGDPTIIALGNNFYETRTFYSCIDQEVIISCGTSEDAVVGLIQGAFIFDTCYPPKLKFTFEFLETVVCRLANGTQLRGAALCASPLVTRLVNSIKKIQRQIEQIYGYG